MIERHYGQIVKVKDVEVMTAVIGGQWAVDYITFSEEDTYKYRDALLKERVKIVRVLPGLIVFEQ